MADVNVFFEGWNSASQTWGGGSWGKNQGLPEASGKVGAATALAGMNASVVGVEASGSVGTVTLLTNSTVVAVGVAGTGGVGAVIAQTENDFPVTGVSATGQAGSVSVVVNVTVNVTGVSATGVVGPVLVYNRIVPDQDPNWTNIAAGGIKDAQYIYSKPWY